MKRWIFSFLFIFPLFLYAQEKEVMALIETNLGNMKIKLYNDTVKYLEAGMFGEGSMAPKIRACLHFIKNGGQKSVITEATKLEDRRYGSKITMDYD